MRALQSLILWISALSAAAPSLYVSWILLMVWRDPMSWEAGSWVRIGVGLLLLEFVLLHSGAFMGGIIAMKESLRNKLLLGACLLLVYGLVVVGFSMTLESSTLFWVFGSVMLGRIVSALLNAREGADAMMAHSAVGILIYIFVVMATVFVPVPEWGITASVLDTVYPNRGSGVWELEPQRAIAGGVVYFFMLGLAELFLLGPAYHQSRHLQKEQTPRVTQ